MNEKGMHKTTMCLSVSGVHGYVQSCCSKAGNICIQFHLLVLPHEDLGKPSSQAPFLRFFQQFHSQERTDGKTWLAAIPHASHSTTTLTFHPAVGTDMHSIAQPNQRHTYSRAVVELKSKFPDNPLLLSFHSLCGISQGSQSLFL